MVHPEWIERGRAAHAPATNVPHAPALERECQRHLYLPWGQELWRQDTGPATDSAGGSANQMWRS
jgi:hypothetical protein